MSTVEHAVTLLVIKRMKQELLQCAQEVARIQSNRLVPEYKKDVDCSYYRQRIYKLEVAIAAAEEEQTDGT